MKKLIFFLLCIFPSNAFAQVYIAGKSIEELDLKPYLVLEPKSFYDGMTFQLVQSNSLFNTNKSVLTDMNGEIKIFRTLSEMLNFMYRNNYELIQSKVNNEGSLRILIFKFMEISQLGLKKDQMSPPNK